MYFWLIDAIILQFHDKTVTVLKTRISVISCDRNDHCTSEIKNNK